MCIGSAPSIPAPPPPPVLPAVPQLPDQGASSLSTDPRLRAVSAIGVGATDVTGPQGLTSSPDTTSKTLLGS